MGDLPAARRDFVAALALDNPGDRHDYLATACGSDTALRGRVDRLLNALNRAGNFLQTPPAADASQLASRGGTWEDSQDGEEGRA